MNKSRVLLSALSLACGLWLSAPQVKAQTETPENVSAAAASSSSVDIFVRALRQHIPVLKFDSGEDFFPIRVRAITDNVGNRLLRENDALLAERERGGKGLNIRYLRGINKGVYPNGDAILESDKLDERGGDPDDHIREDAARFQNSSRYGDRIYGRVVRLRDGERVTGAWLQYWFFYYHNDFPRTDIGDHEGDFEMVQVKVDANAKPLFAVYAHHKGASKCGWDDVRKRGSRPIVYVALGSHASYFRSGPQGQDRDNDGARERRLRGLIRIGTSSPQWLNWPGVWGGSGASPRGPKRQGEKWSDPESFFANADPEEDCKQ